MRNNTTYLLAFLILLALVKKSTEWPARLFIEFVVKISSSQQSLSRERQRNAARIDRNPSSSPLFCDISRSSRSTRWIEDHVSGIRCQQKTSFGNFHIRLNCVDLLLSET